MDDLPERYQKTYLGDGVYAYFDGYNVCLTTLEGHRIFLEPAVYRDLQDWLQKYPRLKRHMEGRR